MWRLGGETSARLLHFPTRAGVCVFDTEAKFDVLVASGKWEPLHWLLTYLRVGNKHTRARVGTCNVTFSARADVRLFDIAFIFKLERQRRN